MTYKIYLKKIMIKSFSLDSNICIIYIMNFDRVLWIYKDVGLSWYLFKFLEI